MADDTTTTKAPAVMIPTNHIPNPGGEVLIFDPAHPKLWRKANAEEVKAHKASFDADDAKAAKTP